ncbi:MAG: hypothetical protein KAS32_13625 [Candidatus Peribacteraceae bacterium]|nr:hypothetical protein [Candidatus Peribacteraceae bacterium]
MDSFGNEENSTKAASSHPKRKVDVEELQHALDVLAKYGIIPNPKLIQEKTGVKIHTNIIATVRGADGEVKKIYEYENGKLK